MYIISFDCGIKNFAYSCIQLNNNINVNNVNNDSIDSFFDNNKYNIISINNVNLHTVKSDNHILEEKTKKKTKKTGNCINLHNHVVDLLLNTVSNLNINENIKILIEYQMNINHKANIIYNIIITFFETYYKINNKQNYEIITVQPAYKNNIAQKIDSDDKIRIKYVNQYAYNKKIVTMYFLSLNTKYNFIDTKQFKKMDDISDSFIQILSYLLYYYNK